MKKFLVIAFAALLTVALAGPAMAKMKIGGILFTDFYYASYDKANTVVAGPLNKTTAATTLEDDLENTRIGTASHSRFYTRWTNEDNVGLYVELQTSTQAVNLRHYYGWWDVNPTFRLMAGHSTTPFSPLTPNQLIGFGDPFRSHIIGLGYGEFYSGRFPQVRFQFNYPNKMGRLGIALIDPSGGANTAPASEAVGVVANEDTTIPRLDIGSPLYFGALKLYPSLFWQTKSFDDVAPGVDDDYDAWGLSLGLNWGAGPLNVRAEVNYGENWGETNGVAGAFSDIAAFDGVRFVDNDANGVAETAEDTELLGWWLDLSFKMGPATPHFIIGSLSAENDGLGTTGADDWELEAWMYGVSVPIALAKGFTLRPELMYYDHGDDQNDGTDANADGVPDDMDYGDEFILGVQFQITF